MSKKDLHQFAIAVFFLFATIGPLTLLMDSAIIQASWMRLTVMTFLCGMFSWAIVMSFNKPLRLLASVLTYVTIIMTMSFTDPKFLQPDVDTITVTSGTPFQLSQEQLSDINVKRAVFGVTAMFCIIVGYTLFVRAIGKEHKRRAEIEAEVKLAQTIHESLLPKSPLTTPWCDIAGASVPASQIGGDFYDIIKISDSKILVVIADASGHGTGAGILSAMTKSGIIQELQHTHSPSELLKNVNATIHGVTKKNMFVTCALALFDNDTKMVSIVTAGHPPILHYNLVKDAIEEHRMHNLALGISPAAVFESKTIPFRTNDIFCFITDGLTETSNAKSQQFGMDRVKSLIRNAPERSAQQINTAMIEEVKMFAHGSELSDDITTVVARIQ